MYGLTIQVSDRPGAMKNITTQTLREQFETNLFGLHECTRQVIPIMRAQGYGKIIQHSSVLGFISLFGRGAYKCQQICHRRAHGHPQTRTHRYQSVFHFLIQDLLQATFVRRR